MKTIEIVRMHMENFKKFKDFSIEFGKTTTIHGQNYQGKSSIADAFSWVMFNKSSTGNAEGKQFRPRRYDEKGVNIDHVDVVVELELLIDGEAVKIRKVQRQNWIRHRGDEYETYEGDVTMYEWNDVPVSATDHKKRVAEIISEDVFLLLTNPEAFPGKKEKEQREFLLKNIANLTDADVFAAYPEEFAPLAVAMGNKTIDELQAKNKKDIELLEKKQKELPVRIDQESKHIQDIDFTAEEIKAEQLRADLTAVEEKISDAGKAYEHLNDLKTNKAMLHGELKMLEKEIGSTNAAARLEIKHRMDLASNEFDYLHESQTRAESALQITKNNIQLKEKELAGFREKYMAEMNKEMNPEDNFCPTCGREFEEAEREQIAKEFREHKANQLKSITESGNAINAEIASLKERAAGYEKEIEELKAKKIEAMRKQNAAKAELENFDKTAVTLESHPEYITTMDKITAIDKEIEEIDTSDADALKTKLNAERAGIQNAINETVEKLALKAVIEKAKVTVSELREEMTETVQNLANCEKLKNLIERFEVKKQEMLSDEINKHFEYITWQLFRKQKNGRTENVCVCQINGSPYGENTTSTTERMMAGMDIIKCLHKIYGVKAPIFLDDADLYNDWNIPDMDCQLIKLCVSDDEDLVIERE